MEHGLTFEVLLSKPEFWAALFGALAAFLLGTLATWWANLNAKRTAGNLAIISLSQMATLMENLRYELVVGEPIRIYRALHREPLSFEIRPAAGLPETLPTISSESLGFLADSYDPDILNRLLTVERAFALMFDLLRRHELAHTKMTEKMNALDPTGRQPFGPQVLLQAVGAKPLIEIDVLIEGLEKGLPETRDMLFAVGEQLRKILCVQIPFRRFLGFSPAPRSRLSDHPPELPKPALWRRATRSAFDLLFKRRRWFWDRPSAATPPAPDVPIPPAIKRFPPRSWETETSTPAEGSPTKR